MRSIAVISGKGGSGKSAIALNLGIALALLNKKVLLIDADVAMANIGILIGVERAPISLQNVLLGEADAKDAVFSDPGATSENKLQVLPSSLSVEKLSSLNFKKFSDVVAAFKDYDFVLVDCPPGIDLHMDLILKAVGEAILVLTPDPSGLADALKAKLLAERNNVKLLGFVVNKVQFDKSEISTQDLESVMGLRQVTAIPEDFEMRKSTSLQVPLIRRSPNCAAARRLKDVASFLTNEKFPVEEASVKKGFLQLIIEKLFGNKK